MASYTNVSSTAISGHHGTAQMSANPLSNTGTLTNMLGCPVAHNKNSMTAGPHGPVVFNDTYLLEKMKQFAREKTPPRAVHSLGCGAAGKFTVTSTEISKYCKAKVFDKVGKTTPVAVRMSGTFTENGEPDTVRDIRGFACKFKTEEGNWDLMAINTPVFNCRDMKIGPDAVHSCKRDPRTGMWNGGQLWDFAVHHPESLHQTIMLFTDKVGTPASFRMMHGWGANTYSMINSQNQRFWIRWHLVSQQDTKGFNVHEAKLIAGEDVDFLKRDLKEAIESGNFPKWKLCVQVMSEEEGYKKPIAFDCTKVWPHADYPLIEIGVLELNKNPVDHFTEVESIAFSPANIVPGIGFSPDKLLQGRLFIYDDTQHHRLGPNFKWLPINSPIVEPNSNYYNGGNFNNQTKAKYPHYDGSVYGNPKPDPSNLEPPMKADGPCDFYDMINEGTDEDYYAQPREFLRVLPQDEKDNLVFNLAANLSKVPNPNLHALVLGHFAKIDPQFASLVQNGITGRLAKTAPMTEAEKLVQTSSKLFGLKDPYTPMMTKSA